MRPFALVKRLRMSLLHSQTRAVSDCKSVGESQHYTADVGTDLGTKLCETSRNRWDAAESTRPGDRSEQQF